MNCDDLKDDLENEIMGAMFNGIPSASVELANIQYADAEELIKIAERWGIK